MQDATLSTELTRLLGVLAGRRVVALTGAGCSTESGIPDYRGPETARRARNPIQYRAFLGRAHTRQRYWARSFIGWQRVARATPNGCHHAVTELERAGLLVGVITQNVDGLHQAAGSDRVVELHGSLAEVRCLACDEIEPRRDLQMRLAASNPHFDALPLEHAPDGDAELGDDAVAGFRVLDCLRCRGVLKPNVVFFGEHVPADVTRAAWELFDEAEALLVLGSSLTVFSGYRFVRRAAERQVPVAIINRGPTRGDGEAAVLVDAALGQVMPALSAALLRAPRLGPGH